METGNTCENVRRTKSKKGNIEKMETFENQVESERKKFISEVETGNTCKNVRRPKSNYGNIEKNGNFYHETL